MAFHLRTVNLPDDYRDIAMLTNVFHEILHRPSVTSQGIENQDKHIPAEDHVHFNDNGLLTGFCRTRVLAHDETGQVVGYASAWRAPFTNPGRLASILVVHPDFRGRGAGALLWSHLSDWGKERGASEMVSEIPDHLPGSNSFAERRGFRAIRHMWQSTLDLAQFDGSPYDSLLRGMEAAGICLLPWSEFKESGDVEELYALFRATAVDNPAGGNSEEESPDFDEWLEAVSTHPQGTMFAVDIAQKKPVGMTILTHPETTHEVYNDYTGVARSHRGRKIALALKVMSLMAARKCGATMARTDNDSENASMLAVNRRLGFVAVPGGHFVVRRPF